MNAAERAYQLLLLAYPGTFRSVYGREMTLVFRDQCRAARTRGVSFWTAIIWDVARSAPALRLEVSRALWHRNFQTGEDVAMKMAMAILSILIGAVEAMNSLQEVWVRGALNPDAALLIGGTIGTVAGMLLLSAGITLLRGSARAAELAMGAAITCLGVFVLVGLVKPQMSMFATLLGIGFPIALLLYLRVSRGQGSIRPVTT